MNLRDTLGGIDIYLLDQLLRGHVAPGSTVLDAGCGSGRNLHYFMKQGFDVYGADQDERAIQTVRQHAAELGVPADENRFRVESLEALSFDDGAFDLVICNAVLHFARDDAHFQQMADSLQRVTRPGGLCFCRVASTIGIETLVGPLGPPHDPRWHHLPDGSDRFLVDIDYLIATSERLGVTLVDPIKTVNVQNKRCMTNWVWRRTA